MTMEKEMTPAGEKHIIRSTCRMCHGVCRVLVHLEGDRVVKVTGDPESPTSRGYICPKGAASPELLYHAERITEPLRRKSARGENKWEPISWEEALDEMAARLSSIRDESGPEHFALVQGTGRPYTDFTRRFANAFGTPNFSDPAHICYGPRALAGAFTVGPLHPPFPDIYGFGGRMPKCFVVWGSNVTGLGSNQGVCAGMVSRALKAAEKVIVVDPRRIGPAKAADHWLQIRPGTDGALALAWIHLILAEDLIDHEFVERHAVGIRELAEHVSPFTPEWAASITRIPAEHIRSAARTYASTSPAAIHWGSAIDMSRCSFQTARSLMILRAITGNIDRPGGDVMWVPPSDVRMKSQFANREITGMLLLPLEKHGRAVDSLNCQNQRSITDHVAGGIMKVLDFVKRRHYDSIVALSDNRPIGSQIKRLSRLKNGKYPLAPGVHQPTLWKSIVTGDPYRIRGLWIVGSNPLASASNPRTVERALRLMEYTVVSDLFLTPTAQYADLVLPASTWLEQDDVVNYLKLWCVTARKKVAQVGNTKDDRDVILELAPRLGLTDAFPWKDYRSFIDWMLQDTAMSFDELCDKGVITGEMRYNKFSDEGFPTPSGKVELYSSTLQTMGVSPLPEYREPPVSPDPDTAQQYPMILTTGSKPMYFFHSEHRQIPSLRKRNPDPLLEIHPDTAGSLGVREGDWVWIETPQGRVKMRAKLFDGIAPDVVGAQPSWWFPEAPPPEYGWKRSNVNILIGEMEHDPDNGSESLRSVLCKVYRVEE